MTLFKYTPFFKKKVKGQKADFIIIIFQYTPPWRGE